MTKTEIQHIYFGIGICVMALLALWAWWKPRSMARCLWPSAALVIGLFLFLPAEGGRTHYMTWGWGETIRELWPIHFDRWLPALARLHVLQHKLAGALTLFIGAVELGRAAGVLRRTWWGRLLPYMTIGVGMAISFHGGTEEHLPNAVEQLHHWMFGVLFVAAGALLALHQAGRLRARVWRYAWPLLVFAAGLDLALFYRLPAVPHLH